MKRLNLTASLTLLLLSAACWLAPGLVRADVTFETKVNGSTQTAYVAAHKFAASSDEGNAIFRGDKQVLWVLNPKDKTYTEMTEADVQAMGSKMGQAMAQMQEALKNVPAEQRAMVEKMMKGKMPAASEVQRTVKPMGVSKSINGFECNGYQVSRSDGQSLEVWAADPKSVKLNPDDLTVFKEFSDFIGPMVPQTSGIQEMIKDYAHPKDSDVPGIPILTIQKDKDGKETLRAEVLKIDQGTVDPAQFEVPSGFARQAAPGEK